MNNKNIETTRNILIPYFVKLSPVNRSRIITKHLVNCVFYMDINHYAMLLWLIYQSKQDNTVRYSTTLLDKYRESIRICQEERRGYIDFKISRPVLRRNFKYLIENGYLLCNYDKMLFTINPMLTYRDKYLKASEYEEVMRLYENIRFGTGGVIQDVGKLLSEIINNKIKDKKK